MSDFDPFLVDSSSAMVNDSDDAFTLGSEDAAQSRSTQRKRNDQEDDFKLPPDMEEMQYESTSTTESSSYPKPTESSCSRKVELTIGNQKKKRRVRKQQSSSTASRPRKQKSWAFLDDEFPSSESESDESVLEKNIVNYLESQMSSVCEDFLTEFKFEIDKAFCFQSQIDQFMEAVLEEVQNVAREEEMKTRQVEKEREPIEEEIKTQFSLLLNLPGGKEPIETDDSPSWRVIDHAKTDFMHTCKEYLNEYRNEVNQLHATRGKICDVNGRKRKALLDAEITLEQQGVVLDELSSFIEERLMRMKNEQRLRREKYLRQMDLQSNDIFTPKIHTAEDLDGLISLINDYETTQRMTACRLMRSDAMHFRDELQSLTDSFCFCVHDFLRTSTNFLSYGKRNENDPNNFVKALTCKE